MSGAQAKLAEAPNPRWLEADPMGAGGLWVLADRRAGTAAQPLGIAERLGLPYRAVTMHWSGGARLPLFWPSLGGLTADARHGIAAPWPTLVLSAGRRSVPVARWLAARGAKLVHCMWPDFGPAAFDLLVIGRHDDPYEGKNIFPILGACNRLTPRALEAARAEWPELGRLPSPRVALLVGGPVRGENMKPARAGALAAQVAGFAGSVMATTSRRTGLAAGDAIAAALAGKPHLLHRWEAGQSRNPYAAMLAWADAIVVTSDSISMVSEAMVTRAPIFLADPGGVRGRHRRFGESLIAAGQVKPLEAAPAPFDRVPLDETGRVAAEIRARGLI